MIAGMYLGEIVRLILLDLCKQGVVFGEEALDVLETKGNNSKLNLIESPKIFQVLLKLKWFPKSLKTSPVILLQFKIFWPMVNSVQSKKIVKSSTWSVMLFHAELHICALPVYLLSQEKFMIIGL